MAQKKQSSLLLIHSVCLGNAWKSKGTAQYASGAGEVNTNRRQSRPHSMVLIFDLNQSVAE
jgi:hypothetical protein